jgi:hypothetical protein
MKNMTPNITSKYLIQFCVLILKLISKTFRGKDLQRRLADRARELEDDNKDRQREREELEEMKLRMLTSSARATPNTPNATLTPNSLLEKYKKPSETAPTPAPPPASLFLGLKMELKPSINSRLQAIATNQNQAAAAAAAAINNHDVVDHKEDVSSDLPKPTLLTPVSINPLSNPTTPISLVSPAQPLKSPAISTKSAPPVVSINDSPVIIRPADEDSGHSFSPVESPGIMGSVSPQNFNAEGGE